MALSFVPGELADGLHTSCTSCWGRLLLTAYVSGNNAVLSSRNGGHLQTLYLPGDASAIDINTANGKLAVVVGSQILVYSPVVSNFHLFNYHGRKDINELNIQWELELTVENIEKVKCICWSDYSELPNEEEAFMELPREFNSHTDCEFVTGSAQGLKLHRLFYLADDPQLQSKILWSQTLPVEAYMVKFSPNATCIAVVGKFDKIVKLFHRCSFGSDFNDFELRCLNFKSYVTSLSWKKFHCLEDYKPYDSLNNSQPPSTSMTPSASFLKPSNTLIRNDQSHLYISKHSASENNSIFSSTSARQKRRHNVLYTVLHDKTLMVHSTFKDEVHGFELFQAGEFDFSTGPNENMWISILDEPYLEFSINKLLTSNITTNEQNAQLAIILGSHSELLMTISSNGLIKIYLISNLSSFTPARCSFKSIKQYQLTQFCLPHDSSLTYTSTANMCYNSYPSENFEDELVINILDLKKHTLRLIGFRLNDLLTASPNDSMGTLLTKFTGHNKSVQSVIKSVNGKSFLAVTRFKENCLWEPIPISNKRVSLSKKCIIMSPEPLANAVILDHSVITILNGKLLMYKCTSPFLDNIDIELDVGINQSPSCFFIIPKHQDNQADTLVAVFPDHQCKAWHVTSEKIEIVEIESVPLMKSKPAFKIQNIIPVELFNHVGRDIIAMIDSTGLVQTYYITRDEQRKIHWQLRNSFDVQLPLCSIMSCTSINKLSISKDNKLFIWDTKLGTLEYQEEFDEPIRDLDWTSTNFGQGILAIGFKHESILLTQLRYDYTNNTQSFIKIKHIDIRDQTDHSIGDSIWLSNGLLILGVGNQFYISDKSLDLAHDDLSRSAMGTLEIISNDLFHLCSALNGPLPVYHPQMMIQLVLAGKIDAVSIILRKLSIQLRDLHLGSREEIDFNLGLDLERLLLKDDSQINIKSQRFNALFQNDKKNSDDDNDTQLTELDIEMMISKLSKYKLPFMTGHQQITLSQTIVILHEIRTKSLHEICDINGIRFFFVMKLLIVNVSKSMHSQIGLRMRDIFMAIHSDNRDILLDMAKIEMSKLPSLSAASSSNELSLDWANVKRFGLPYWLEPEILIPLMEQVAKNEFMKYQLENQGAKDPNVCSLPYLALRKKQILIGLWKTSYNNSEREKMIKFLSNDFNQPRWKSAANKNAFVLLGKHRYREAATFFLLAGSIKDCVAVIMKQMNDLQLAIAIAKCYDGVSNGEGMKFILQRTCIPMSIVECDRWRISWCFSALKDKEMAIKSLIIPFDQIVRKFNEIFNMKFNTSLKQDSANFILRSKNIEDPMLLVMYQNLQNRKLVYREATKEVPMENEFSFILNVCSMYTKLGCDWLGYDLIRKWEFTDRSTTSRRRSILDSFDESTISSAQQRKPGDILAKFMAPSNSSKPKSILDKFDNGHKNMLDGYNDTHISGGSSILNAWGGPSKPQSQVPSMLDAFDMPPQQQQAQKKQPLQPKSLLDDFSLPPDSQLNTNASGGPVNLLDQWT